MKKIPLDNCKFLQVLLQWRKRGGLGTFLSLVHGQSWNTNNTTKYIALVQQQQQEIHKGWREAVVTLNLNMSTKKVKVKFQSNGGGHVGIILSRGSSLLHLSHEFFDHLTITSLWLWELDQKPDQSWTKIWYIPNNTEM